MSSRLVVGLVVVACVAGCTRPAPAPVLQARELEAPAGPGSGEPNLALAPDGRVLLSWLEPRSEGRHALRLASRPARGAWSEAHTVAEGAGWFVNWADVPSVAALADGTLYAHWLVEHGGDGHAYDVQVALSRDGRTWSRPVTPHRDGTASEHGFVSLTPWAPRAIGLVWLDGRKTAGASHGAAVAETSLMHSTLDADGRLGDEVVLDGRVCDCCQTDAARADGATVVVYRDRSPAEVRDIAVVRFAEGRWSEPRPLAEDGWQIHGCPVNGPAVAAAGPLVAAAWFTAAGGQARVKVAFSSDSGVTFGPPLVVDDGKPLGRVDVALLDGRAVVSWLEQRAEGVELRVRMVPPGGAPGEALTVAASSAARSSGFPRLAASGGEVLAAWRDAGTPARVHTAVLSVGRRAP